MTVSIVGYCGGAGWADGAGGECVMVGAVGEEGFGREPQDGP